MRAAEQCLASAVSVTCQGSPPSQPSQAAKDDRGPLRPTGSARSLASPLKREEPAIILPQTPRTTPAPPSPTLTIYDIPIPGPPDGPAPGNVRDLAVGSLVASRYEVRELLGRGGMGSVFRAHDVILDRDVALKQMHAHLLDRHDLLDRVNREGQILARLDHPGIVRILDVLHLPDASLIQVLEFVPGRSLAQVFRENGRLLWPRCVHIVTQVCGALSAAHDVGVVHRDIKPANIQIGPGDAVSVMDFGISRLAAGPTVLTREGSIIGTPDYWAPEQATGQAVTAASDLYSVACVLFEAACGRPPFVAETDSSPAAVFLMHVVHGVPDPKEFRSDLSDRARDVILQGLAKEPAQRFPSAIAFAGALEQTLSVADTEDGSKRYAPASSPPRQPPPDDPGPKSLSAPSPDDEPSAGMSYSAPTLHSERDAPTIMPAPSVGGASWFRRSLRNCRALLAGRPPEPEQFTPQSPRGDTSREELMDGRSFAIRVVPGFRIITGSLGEEHHAMPFLANQEIVDSLAARLHRSVGGTHLVAGFAGAGKSTVVERALKGQRRVAREDVRQLVVRLDLSRVQDATTVAARMIRALHARADAEGNGLIAPEVLSRLEFAARRTYQSLSDSTATSDDVGANLRANIPRTGLGVSVKRSRLTTRTHQASFSPYTLGEIEHDLLDCLATLDSPSRPRATEYHVRAMQLIANDSRTSRLRVVFVLDELDKMLAEKGGPKALKSYFAELKSILCSPCVTVIMIMGPEVLVELDRRAGYEAALSLSASTTYVPCNWDVASQFLEAVDHLPAAKRYDRRLVNGFLSFHARGLFRPLIREVADLLVGAGEEQEITIHARKFAWVNVACFLDEAIRETVRTISPRELEEPWEEDWRRMQLHNAARRVLQLREQPFSVDDLSTYARGQRAGPDFPGDREHLIARLTQAGFLEKLEADEVDASDERYVVASGVCERLGTDSELLRALRTQMSLAQ